MPALSELTTDQINALRSGGWAGDLRFAVCPSDIVFQATVNQTITGQSFISFAWDGLLDGAYTDVVAGMTFFITATDDPLELRNPLLRGRASQAPTSTIFYCNESAINLTDGMIVTVISNFEVLQKDRIGNLVDGWQSYENLSPLVKNMQAFYYGEDATEFSFSFAPQGQAMAQGATISAYQWTIAGGTYTVGNANTQNITVTVPYGHTWAYLDITDSNSVVYRLIFEILVCPRDDSAFMFMAHDDVSISGSVDNGWNVSTTFFAGVEDLLNRTRCALVAFDVPKVGDTDLFSNVAFVGYIVQEGTDISADPVSSILSQTSFEFQSFADIAGQIPVPSLAIRNIASPSAWDQMNLPTPQRVIAHLMTRYSTLASLCPIDVLFTDSTWFGGEMDLEEGTLLDSINRIGREIQAQMVFFPQGDATFEINGNFLSDTDRDALPSLLSSGNIEQQDLFDYSLPVPYYKTVGQVIAGCATFYTDGSTPVKLEAIAPATARQEGNERPVILAQLLEANLTQSEAITAGKQRIGDLLEYLNPDVTLPTTLTDGWHVLTPSTRVWITYNLPGTDSTRGLSILPAARYWLQSVSLTWRVNSGAWDVSGVSRLETRGGLAQTKATISPNTITTETPVLPILADYDAFAPDGSLNYESTSPDTDDLQPYSPFDLSQFTPMTTEDAASSADNTAVGDCQIINPPVNFKSNVTRQTSEVTVNGQPYTITVKGSARIEEAVATCEDLTVDDFGWYASNNAGTPTSSFGLWTSGEGLTPNQTTGGFFFTRQSNPLGVGSVSSITFNFNQVITNLNLRILGNTPILWSGSSNTVTFDEATYPAFFPVNLAVSPIAITTLTNTLSTSARVVEWCWEPVSGVTVNRYADAFYVWELDANEDPTNVELNPDGGLLVNGSPVAVPPEWNENSEYEFVYEGDGNVVPFIFYDTDYSDNQNAILYIRVCGPGMGS